MALATLSDLGVRLGLDLDGNDRAQALLDDASAAVTGYTGRSFTEDETTETLTVEGGKVTLSHGPVLEIVSVEVDGDPVEYTWSSGRKVTIDHVSDFAWSGAVVVEVTYSHGYAAVPADIVAVVCQIAGRAYGTNPQRSGYTAESLGDHSETLGSSGASGALGILPDERAVLNRYRGRPRAPIAQTPWVVPG